MRTIRPAFLLALALALPFTSCEKEEEADPVYINGGGGGGTGGTGGTGRTGGTGGTGGSGSGAVDPDDISIDSEAIFSCDGGGTDYVCYDSTSLVQQLFTTSPTSVTSCNFTNFSGVPYAAQIQMYGLDIAGADATPAEMDAFFAPGERDFSLAVGTTPGAFVAIIEDSGDMSTWYRSNLNAQPASSHFTITDAEGWMDGSIYKVKVRAVFQCRMWSVSGGNSMDRVDGIFVGDFTSDAL